MRVAVASFEFEGNTLSARLHRHDDFARKVLAEGPDMFRAVEGKPLAVTGGIDRLREAGLEVIPVLVAHGGSGGRVEDAFYADMRGRILAGIEGAMPLDGVFLALHGAMVCETMDDAEGDLLAAVRALVGPGVRVAASLDLHAHVTPRMVAAADILVGYETYPHNDVYTTGRRAAALLADAVAGLIRPVTRLRRIDALLPVLGGATRDGMPMARLRETARRLEQAGRALSASYFPVQPWLDIPGVGIAAVAVTDGDPATALEAATELVREMWDRRREFELPSYPPDQAVRRALSLDAATVILSDAPDCVGGGAAGDGPAVLAALLRIAPEVEAVVLVVDPDVSRAAFAVGTGAMLRTQVGSRLDPRFHAPVMVEARVESLHDGAFFYDAGISAGTPGTMGPTAVMRCGGVRIVVPTHATYEYGDEQYRACGIDFRGCRLAAFKNPMNFRNLLGPGIDWLAIDGPGPTTPRLETIAWQVKHRPFWPCDDAPEPVFLD
jgi:microcystin degradation protein MlrC